VIENVALADHLDAERGVTAGQAEPAEREAPRAGGQAGENEGAKASMAAAAE
jgi:hypothetical protein